MPVSDAPPLANARSSVKDHDRADDPRAARAEHVGAGHGARVIRVELAEGLADQADHDHQDDRTREQVGGDGEGPARLLEAAQVAVTHQEHDADADLQLVRPDGREGGRDGGGAGRDLDGDRHHVVDQQRHRADLGYPRTEVVPRDDIGAARPDVHHDDLAVGQHHERHHEQDDQRQRQDQGERRQAHDRHQRDQDLFRAVGRRRDPVRRQNAEREGLGQPLLAELLVHERRAEKPRLRGVPEPLGLAAALLEQADGLRHGHYPGLSSIKRAGDFIPPLTEHKERRGSEIPVRAAFIRGVTT